MQSSKTKLQISISKPSRAISMTALIFLLITSCSKQEGETIKSFKNLNQVPSLYTTKITSLISDSGVTRYRLTTDEWSVYERGIEPYWHFPKGITVEKFDSLLHVEASIKADTAYFYEHKKLWILRKKVSIKNLQGETFETEELFWDQYKQQISSKKFIRIKQKDKIITGIGFESNESMTRYLIHKTQGIFEIDETKTDTVK